MASENPINSDISNGAGGDDTSSQIVTVNGSKEDIWSYPVDKLYQWAVEYYKSGIMSHHAIISSSVNFTMIAT
jgi:hypothetical protein